MSNRTKLTVLAVVIAAILYVRISPLPELAAHGAIKSPIISFMTLVILFFASVLEPPHLVWHAPKVILDNRDTLLALTCVRLC